MEAVFSIVRKIRDRGPDDPMDDLDVNMAIWGIFLKTTLQAAVHLGQNYGANLRFLKNYIWNSVGQLFNETGKLISEQTEIIGVNTVGFKDATWMSTSLLCEKAQRITNAKTYVFSDSVLCVGKRDMILLRPGRATLNDSENNHFKEMNRMEGMPTEFEWEIFPGITTLGLLEKIQRMRDLQCEPEHFNDRISIMSVQNDIAWQEKGNKERCEYNSQTVANYARKFPRDHWSFLRPGSEEKWYGTFTDKPDGSWDQTAKNMMANFSESGHPTFRASSAFERGELRSNGGRKKSIHFNGSCFSER